MCKSQHVHKTEKQEEEGIKNMRIRMFLRRIFLGLESKIRYFTQFTNVFAWGEKKPTSGTFEGQSYNHGSQIHKDTKLGFRFANYWHVGGSL